MSVISINQVDIRVRVKGGGHTAQIYAIRQAIAKGIVAFYQKCECQFVVPFSRCHRPTTPRSPPSHLVAPKII
jgi:hypothetical protein